MKRYFPPSIGLVCLSVVVMSVYMLILSSQPLPELPAESLLEHRLLEGESGQ